MTPSHAQTICAVGVRKIGLSLYAVSEPSESPVWGSFQMHGKQKKIPSHR